MKYDRRSWWSIWKHALGSFNENDGYQPRNENIIAIIRSFIVLSNLCCVKKTRDDYVKFMSGKRETHRELCIRTGITQYDL